MLILDYLHRTWAEISLSALENNFKEIKNRAKSAKIMAVVKANAYGHGADIVAPFLEKLGADAVVSIIYTTSAIMEGASEVLAYGTAVKFKEKE